jgi:hypothetical protein
MSIISKNNRLTGLILALTLVLSACGGSGGSSGSPPANTKLTANISNQTTSDISSITIEEHSTGKVFFSGDFVCATKKTDCKFYYTGSDSIGPLVILLKDSKSRVVGIYDIDNAPGAYIAPEITLTTTGAYLYEVLVKTNSDFQKMSEVERQAVLSVFVSAKDTVENEKPVNASKSLHTQTDHYEELALNYLNKQGSGSITVAAYINELGKRLSKREVAAVNEFLIPANLTAASTSSIRFALEDQLKKMQNIKWINTAHAQDSSSSCTDGLAKFMALFQGATGAIPSAFPIASGIGKAVSAIGSTACNSQKLKMDAIINQLNVLQNSLNNLSDDVGRLTNFVAAAQMNTNLQDFTTVGSDLSQLAGNYQIILNNNQVGSLKDYVRKVGGSGADALNIVLSKEPDGVFAKLLGRLPANSDQSYLLQIQRLTENQFDTLNAAIDLLCKNPRTGDVIKLRVQCNLVIGTSTARLLTAQNIAYQIASDTYDLLEAYPTEATRFAYDLSKTAAQNKAVLKEKFDKQADLMASRYSFTVQNSSGTKGVYDSFDGLPTALLASISAANCNGNQSDPYARIQSITSWVKETSNEHIVTNCKNFATPILARYYLKLDGKTTNSNDVGNVMGVLVPFDKITTRDTAMLRDALIAGLGSGLGIYLVLQPNPVPYTFAINSVYDGSSRWIYDQLFNGGEDKFYRLTKAKGTQIVDILPSWIDQLTANCANNSFNCFSKKQFVRYTDKSGYSIVFAIELMYSPNTAVDTKNLYYCITGDCTNKSSTDQLSFKDGPLALKLHSGFFYVDGVNLYYSF